MKRDVVNGAATPTKTERSRGSDSVKEKGKIVNESERGNAKETGGGRDVAHAIDLQNDPATAVRTTEIVLALPFRDRIIVGVHLRATRASIPKTIKLY